MCTQITTAPHGTFIVTMINAETAFLGIAATYPNVHVTVNCDITSKGNLASAHTVGKKTGWN